MGEWSHQTRDILAKSGWLTDNIINETPLNVLLGLTLSYTIQTREFIQVLHTGRDHWVTVSTIGCREVEINIYDSLPPTPHLTNQTAALLATPKAAIKMSYMDTQIQSGTEDCGILPLHFLSVWQMEGSLEHSLLTNQR